MQSPERTNDSSEFTSSNQPKDNSSNNNNNNNNNNNFKITDQPSKMTNTRTDNEDDHCQSQVLDMDMKKACDKSTKGLNNSTTSSSSSSGNDQNSSKDEVKEIISDDEEMDEPDAMLSSSPSEQRQNFDKMSRGGENNNDSFGKQQYNGYMDSGDEDMDEDDRLVIDDEAAAAAAARNQFANSSPANMMNQVFSCPQCHVVTTSAKAYLYHLDNVHNVKESGKKPLTSADEEDDDRNRDNRAMGNDSGYLNLSIPIHHNDVTRPSSSLKDDNDDESSMNASSAFNISSKGLSSSMPVGITTDNIDQMFDDDKKKKKKTRQEVDPGKYFEAVDSSGTKYACSQCGNIYKWRKSLNKHWKEKHLNDPLVEVASPPGMLELLKSGKYTQLGSRRIYDNNFLQTIKAQKDDDVSRTSTPTSEIIKSSTPTNFMDASSHSLNMGDGPLSSPMSAATKMIGPFIASTAQPVFPGMSLAAMQHLAFQNGYDSASDEGAMDLTRAAKNAMATYQQLVAANRNAAVVAAAATADLNSSFDQDQPLDFSKTSSNVKSERHWDSSPSPSSMRNGQSDSPFMSKVHRCTKCDYTSSSEVDFANHTSSHYSKRVCKCFECKIQLNSMEELNAHYLRDHNRKLTEYKEAVKKIPHGLQQTYHLLKMDLQSIGELNNQDLGSSDSKSLKCRKCDFEAKWPAELQKHAVSHSEERPYICMVCGSTYKWKWDLVKHFQKSHPALPNPYRRNDKRETSDGSSEDDAEDEPDVKRAKMSGSSSDIASGISSPYNQDDMISVKGIIAASQIGQRFVSSQPNLDDESPSSIEESLALMQSYPYAAAAAAAFASGTPVGYAQEFMERHQKAQKAIQDAIKSRQSASFAKSPSSGSHNHSQSTSPIPMSSSTPSSSSSSSSNKTEQLPYKCTMCNYHARWPSEVTQHMKNHSDCKPYLCPRCDYRSKWKWDVVKHLKRCGGGTINDVIDTTKLKNTSNNSHHANNNNNSFNKDGLNSPSNMVISSGPPNAIVSQQGKIKKTTPQPLSYIVPSFDSNGQPSALVVRSATASATSTSSTSGFEPSPIPSHAHHLINDDGDSSNKSLNCSETIDLTTSNNNNNSNNNNSGMANHNINNNYASYSNGQPIIVPGTNLSPRPGNASTDQSQGTPMSSSTTSLSATTLPPSNMATNTNTPTTNSSSSHRNNSSGEIWDCPHCPFTTQSQAELKRHSGLHMDDKPFKCNECHYSTRWACDLKKHRKSYDHYPRNSNSNFANKPNADSNTNLTGSTMEDNPAKKDNKGRFKCFQCTNFFVNLQGLIDHRKNTHNPSENSSAPQTMDTGEIDAARIRHPRKQIKQFTCPKCPFICKNRHTMDKHIEEHEQMDRESFQCFYCSSQYKDKESLLDHIVTHPTFNAKEWETFFMISEDEEHIDSEAAIEKGEIVKSAGEVSENRNVQAPNKEDQTKMDSEAATQARIQQILDEIPKQKNAQKIQQQQHNQQQQNSTGFNKFKCEWCQAEFINLTAVYKHASQAHPIQLKEQDVSMSQAYANLQAAKNQDEQQQQHSISNSKTDGQSGDAALQLLKQQIAEKRNHQLVEKINHMVSSNPKLQEVLNKRLEEDMNGGKRFQCDKCNFSTSNQSAFQNHYELHGTKFQTQCWFCEYRVDSMEILYQHMKISHTRKWKQLSQDPRYANQIQRMNLAFANNPSGLSSPPLQGVNNNNDSTTSNANSGDSSGVMDLSSKKSPTDLGHDIVYVRKPQYTWSGIPVNVIPDGTALKFVCPKCSFNDASIAKTCSHVMQSHRAMSKFNCTSCQFSDDNIHVMSDHCKTCHPVKERIVEVLDFKQLNFTELQMVQLNAMNAMKEKMGQDVKSDSGSADSSPNKSLDEKPMSLNKLSCPFCPYKTDAKETMKNHISNHSQNARFRCQNCDFSSDLPTLMAEHVKVHEANYDNEQNTAQNLSPSSVKHEKEVSGKNDQTKKTETLEQREGAESPRASPRVSPAAANEIVKAPSPKAKTPGRIRYRCSICPYHTTCKSNIFKHKRQHIIPKRYKCNKCSYSAARAVLLRKHIESHSLPITDEDGYYHDIFYDPHSTSSDKIEDNEEVGEMDVEPEDVSEEDSTSDDLENEINSKAIADLEAKYIMEAEAAHKANASMDEAETPAPEHSTDKQHQLRKQKCPSCPFSSNSVYEFQKHLNFHGTQERYKCDLCTYSIDRFNLLTQHRKLHINDPAYSPNPVPSVLLNTSFILQQNEMAALPASVTPMDTEESSETQRHCTACPFKAANKQSFESHTVGHGQRKKFICDCCDWSADTIPSLHQHRIVHENEPGYKTTPLDSIFLNQEYDDGTSGEFEAKFMEVVDNDKQQKGVENNNDTNNPPPFKLTVVKKSYPCKLCPYKTNSKNNYHIHKSMHSSSGEFSCKECTFSAISLGLLRQHTLLHSSSLNNNLINNNNNNESNSSSSNCDNAASISQSEGLTCQRCPFTASNITALGDHMKGHNGQDTLVLPCPYCDFKATTTPNMYAHIQIHFPGTKLEPEAMAKMLEEHMKKDGNGNDTTTTTTTTGEQSSTSSASSDKTTTKRSSTSPESSQVIKTKIYVCQYCEREFEAKSLMIQHEKQHLVGSH